MWLEQWIRFLTRAPWVLLLLGPTIAAVALQMDGLMMSRGMFHLPAGQALLVVNGLAGVGGLVLGSFAGHAIWFRARHKQAMASLDVGAMPDQPWETKGNTANTAPNAYLRSLGRSSILFAIASAALLTSTPLFGFIPVVSGSALLVALLAGAGRATMYARLKAAGPGSSP